MESFYMYYLLGKIINLNFDKFWKKTFTKRLTMYEHSRFSVQMPLVMAIFLAYFIIKFPYLAHMCIFPWKTILPNGVSDFFLQKMDFPFSFIFFAFSGNTLVPAVILKNRRHCGVAVPAVPEDNRQHCVATTGGRRKMHHRTVRWIVQWPTVPSDDPPDLPIFAINGTDSIGPVVNPVVSPDHPLSVEPSGGLPVRRGPWAAASPPLPFTGGGSGHKPPPLFFLVPAVYVQNRRQ